MPGHERQLKPIKNDSLHSILYFYTEFVSLTLSEEKRSVVPVSVRVSVSTVTNYKTTGLRIQIHIYKRSELLKVRF